MTVAMLRDREEAAAKFLELHGLMVSRPGEGLEESGLKWQWGVCTGSHGGYGKTLRGAMGACLRCCGIGRWWRVGGLEKGLTLAAVVAQAKEQFIRHR